MEIGKRAGLRNAEMELRDYFGEALLHACQEDERIVVLDGDLANSTGASRVHSALPEQFLNVGIAESNLVCIAAGLASNGFVPAISTFSSFLFGNAYDQIRLAINLPKLNVKLFGSHAGVSITPQGPQAMAPDDFSLCGSLEAFTIIVPSDPNLMRAAVAAAFEVEGPVYVRSSREAFPYVYDAHPPFALGQANQLTSGDDVTIIACGIMVAVALDAAAELREAGVEARVLDMHTLRPFDVDSVVRAARETGAIVTAEEHMIRGGLAGLVSQVTAETNPVPVRSVGVRDTPGSGTMAELMADLDLTTDAIVTAAHAAMAAHLS